MIKRIKIQKFKRIDEVDLLLDRFNVFIGTNNAGKSSIIQAIHFAISATQSIILSGKSWGSNNRLTTSLSSEQFLYTPTTNVELLYHNGKLKSKKKGSNLHTIIVEIQEEENINTAIRVGKGKNRNLSVIIEGNRELSMKLSDTDNPFSIYVPGLSGVPNSERYHTKIVVKRASTRGDSNFYLRNILYELHTVSEQWNSFIESLRTVYQDINIEISFDKEKDEFIDIKVKLYGNLVPIDIVGTGILQSIQILSYIYYYSPKLLLL